MSDADVETVFVAKSYDDVISQPHMHAVRFFERSAKRTVSDESDCGSSIDVSAFAGPQHVGLEMTMTLVAKEATFVVSAGLQFRFEQEISMSSQVLHEVLARSVLPALMPILTSWVMTELAVMELSGVVEVPFTEVYPTITENLRQQIISVPVAVD